jgi:DNA-binding CsgD family transcriptional regulator
MRADPRFPYHRTMAPRSSLGNHTPPPSALVLRHLEDIYGAGVVPADAGERFDPQDQWFGVLPRFVDLNSEGVELVDEFRALTPELRGRLLAFAVQGEIGFLSVDRPSAAATGFVDVAQRGRIRWTSDLHRVAVLAGSEPEDHRIAGGVRFSDHSTPRGAAVHLLFAYETVEVADLIDAADFFARADRPSWAVHCLVSAADAATTPVAAAALAAAAANTAALDGDFAVAERVLESFAWADTSVLLRESAPARALRQALVESDPPAGRATIRARLQSDHLDSDAVGQALAAYALINVVDADPGAWEGYIQACSAASVPLHPEIVAIATTIGAPNAASEPHLHVPAATDGRGWSQLARCVATVVYAYRHMRLGSFAPTAGLAKRVGNRLVRAVEATYVSVMLAHNQLWNELETALGVALETTTDTVPVPLMRVGPEAMLAFAEAFRGEHEAARRRVDRVLAEPVVRRAHRLRAILDSVVVMIEGPRGNYEQALALLSTRQSDVLNLTTGPSGPIELFDFVDYALMVREEDQAVARVEQFRDALRQQHSQRADFVLAACDAVIAARTTLAPAEELLARAESLPFVYEAARLRLVYAERLRRARRTAEARRHLLRVEFDLASVQAGAWLDRVQRELRACQREIEVRVADLTEQETRIAELAAGGLSNKEIGARLYLSPRTVGGHLYKVFPKLGISTRAQLRDALAGNVEADDGPKPSEGEQALRSG